MYLILIGFKTTYTISIENNPQFPIVSLIVSNYEAYSDSAFN